MTTRWGDELDDSDDEEDDYGGVTAPPPTSKLASMGTSSSAATTNLKIPPTHHSRIDQQGIQIVTSYRANPSNSNSLIKTITKQRVHKEKMREPKAVAYRRQHWKKFGQAALDEKEGNKTTVQSKDEIIMEDPHADTDLQDEDPSKAIAGNLNAFWAKQQRRQLERKYDVGDSSAMAEGGEAAANGWTQVASKSTIGAAGGGTKYVPPAARMGAVGASAMPSSGMFKIKPPEENLNTIRVTNLSDNVTEYDLQELFQRYGRVSRVYLAKDKETLQSRGFAFVSFVNQTEAAKAMEELQGHGYDHLILKLEWARPTAPKPEGEFRSGYGKALAQDTKSKVSYASNLTK